MSAKFKKKITTLILMIIIVFIDFDRWQTNPLELFFNNKI